MTFQHELVEALISFLEDKDSLERPSLMPKRLVYEAAYRVVRKALRDELARLYGHV